MYFITFQSDCTNDFSYRDFIEASNQVTNNQNIELTRCFFVCFWKKSFMLIKTSFYAKYSNIVKDFCIF